LWISVFICVREMGGGQNTVLLDLKPKGLKIFKDL
jgi:hypothetical protein